MEPMPFSERLRGLAIRRWRDVLDAIIPYGASAFMLLTLQQSPVNQTIDLLLYDMMTKWRDSPSAERLPITIIGIDEEDIATYGWPIDDRYLCAAIDRILADGAVGVGLDLYRDQGVGSDQECLRERFRSHPALVSIFNVGEGIGPVPGTPPGRQGFNDLVVDADGVVRRDLIHVSGQDEATVAFPLRLMEVGLGDRSMRTRLEEGTEPGPWLEPSSGGYERLDAAGYQRMLPFHALGSFTTSSLQDVLTDGRIGKGALRDRIVLIGSTAPSLRDLFPVPHTRFHVGSRQLLISGVEIHAHRLASLLGERTGGGSLQLRTLPGWSKRGLEFLFLAAGLVLGESLRPLRHSVLTVALVATLFLGCSLLLLHQNIWIAATTPLSALVLIAGAAWVRRGGASQRQHQQIEKLLGQTTSPDIARQLWRQRESLLSNGRFEGRQAPVTIVIMDTCRFTWVSEQLTPQELLDWLNRGLSRFIPAITGRGGVVNKFTGDGFLAVFGAPLSKGAAMDAMAAIDAATEIQQSVEVLNEELAAEGKPTMMLRIGIHSGDVVAGSLGSSERLEYGVIGDTVNCASRLETLDKNRQSNTCRILVSTQTKSLIPSDLPLDWQSWGSIELRNRSELMQVWELRGKGSQNPIDSESDHGTNRDTLQSDVQATRM